ncbi:hypothetical protein DRQ33_01940 [bacterium]|nr:MAG: hypothetical protein DRQ33_01940 [bacterium]
MISWIIADGILHETARRILVLIPTISVRATYIFVLVLIPTARISDSFSSAFCGVISKVQFNRTSEHGFEFSD